MKIKVFNDNDEEVDFSHAETFMVIGHLPNPLEDEHSISSSFQIFSNYMYQAKQKDLSDKAINKIADKMPKFFFSSIGMMIEALSGMTGKDIPEILDIVKNADTEIKIASKH